MFFKNACTFKLKEPFEYQPDALLDKLIEKEFTPCGRHQISSSGWIGALGKNTELLYATQGYILLVLAVQQKMIPASVVNEQLEERVLELEHKRGRKVRKKERAALKEDVYAALIPQAFSKTSYTAGYCVFLANVNSDSCGT